MLHLHTESKLIALEALKEAEGNRDSAIALIYQSCDDHEIAIYYHKAIQFCSEQNTNDGEEWLEDCGGIAQPRDSFGQIACRIAFATLLVAAQQRLEELIDETDGDLDTINDMELSA